MAGQELWCLRNPKKAMGLMHDGKGEAEGKGMRNQAGPRATYRVWALVQVGEGSVEGLRGDNLQLSSHVHSLHPPIHKTSKAESGMWLPGIRTTFPSFLCRCSHVTYALVTTVTQNALLEKCF
jgi:hypothetical protein